MATYCHMTHIKFVFIYILILVLDTSSPINSRPGLELTTFQINSHLRWQMLFPKIILIQRYLMSLGELITSHLITGFFKFAGLRNQNINCLKLALGAVNAMVGMNAHHTVVFSEAKKMPGKPGIFKTQCY